MPNPTAAPFARAAVAALLFATPPALLVGGCKSEEKVSAVAPAGAATTKAEFAGVTFEHPVAWKASALPENKGLNVTAPPDAGWEPNVFVEVQPNPENKALDELLTANIELLGARKQDFQVRTQSQQDHPNGFRYGRVEYSNSSESADAAGSVPLTQWSIIIPLPDKKQRLQIQAAAATAVWDKYRPEFEKVVESIRLPK